MSHQRSEPPRRREGALSWESLLEAASTGGVAEVGSRLGAGSRLVGPAVWSDAEPFERFRDRAAAGARPPRARLVGIGSLRDLSAPLGFARQLLVAGGFAVDSDVLESVETAADSLSGVTTDLVVVVLPREAGVEDRARAVAGLREVTRNPIAVTGRDEVPGTRHRLYAGSDVVAVLESLWEEVTR